MTSTVEGVYRSTEYSIVQNRSILKSWTSRLQERPKINFRKMGTLILRSIVRWQSEIILYKSYATPPLRVALLHGRVSPESCFYLRGLRSLRSSRGRESSVGPPQSRWPPSVSDLQWHLQSHSNQRSIGRPHSRNTFLPSCQKWDQNDQVETAFYLKKHHGTLRPIWWGRKVER